MSESRILTPLETAQQLADARIADIKAAEQAAEEQRLAAEQAAEEQRIADENARQAELVKNWVDVEGSEKDVRKSVASFEKYLKKRPADKEGVKKTEAQWHAKTRKELEKLFDSEQVTDYESMGVNELVGELAKLNVANDRTLFSDVDEVLTAKIEAIAKKRNLDNKETDEVFNVVRRKVAKETAKLRDSQPDEAAPSNDNESKEEAPKLYDQDEDRSRNADEIDWADPQYARVPAHLRTRAQEARTQAAAPAEDDHVVIERTPVTGTMLRGDLIDDELTGLEALPADATVAVVEPEVAPTAIPEFSAEEAEIPESPEAMGRIEKLAIAYGVAERALPNHGDDLVLINERQQLFGVIDGMGRFEGGDIAAGEIYGAISDYFDRNFVPGKDPVEVMKEAFQSAREAVIAKVASTPDMHKKAGAVASVIKFYTEEGTGDTRAVYGHVGDTRIYIDTLGSGTMQLTTDQVAKDGTSVTNAIYSGAEIDFEQFGDIRIKAGDRIMICSDGITGDKGADVMGIAEVAAHLQNGSAQEAADSLLEASRKVDDKSVLVIDAMNEVEPPVEPEEAPIEPQADVEPSVVASETKEGRIRKLRNKVGRGVGRVVTGLAPADMTSGSFAYSHLLAERQARNPQTERNEESLIVSETPSVTTPSEEVATEAPKRSRVERVRSSVEDARTAARQLGATSRVGNWIARRSGVMPQLFENELLEERTRQA